MWLIKNRVCKTGTFSAILWDFPGCVAFTPPPPLCNFLKRELSPLHNMNTCCAPPTASGSQETGTGQSFIPLLLLLHPPHQPVIYPSTLATRPTPPLRSPSFSRRALPSLGCYWAGISQTLPLRPVTSSAGRKSEGSSSSCESNPTHLCTFDSREGRAPRGRGGVESPYLLASHSQTTPHHRRRHMAALEGEQYQWKSGKIQVSLLPRLETAATWQWNNVEEEIRLEKKGAERKELWTNDERRLYI